jgi:DNA-binding CsgD family transcriptional regulator
VALAEAIDLGRAGRRDEAEACLTQSMRDFGDPARHFWMHHLALLWAAPHALAGGWGDPVSWIRSSRRAFELAGVSTQVRVCDRLLRATGEAIPRRGRGNATAPEHLRTLGITSREMDVLLLIGQGLGNRDIAGRLYLSPRTVETHVAQLLGKTGARTRVRLAAMIQPPAETAH